MEAKVWNCDQHRNVEAESLFDQEQKPLAFLLMFSEPVDDQQIGAVELIRDLAPGPHQPVNIQTAPPRASAEVLKQLKLLTIVQHHHREFDIVRAVMPELDETDDAMTLCDQIIRETAE